MRYMTARSCTTAVAMLMLCLCVEVSTARADEVIEASPMTQLVHGLNPMNWKMPDFRQLLPGNDEKARIKKKKEGLMDEVTKTASNSWSKTKQALNPVKFLPASSRTPSPASRQQAEQPGFFRSLFGAGKPAAQEKPTVTDFLRQERPGL